MESLSFIVIDDDPVSNLICKLTLEMVLGKVEVKTFTNPEEGLRYIELEYSGKGEKTAALLLDINMPVMTGWEFLERFDNLNKNIKNSIVVYILSSSVDPRDKDRSYSNKNVKNYIVKPLTPGVIESLTEKTKGWK